WIMNEASDAGVFQGRLFNSSSKTMLSKVDHPIQCQSDSWNPEEKGMGKSTRASSKQIAYCFGQWPLCGKENGS
ncbi:MAG TPA: hypothetical protein P5563_09145, partial [Saprospiraceae bacterium]|nr:hypothetical protein [Saprospiraceae bacterium]